MYGFCLKLESAHNGYRNQAIGIMSIQLKSFVQIQPIISLKVLRNGKNGLWLVVSEIMKCSVIELFAKIK